MFARATLEASKCFRSGCCHGRAKLLILDSDERRAIGRFPFRARTWI
jgi:hypothetical protein